MKHLFIVNPAAGGSNKEEKIRSMLVSAFAQREDEFEIYLTKAPMDACEEIKRRAEACEELRVYACGGDGTFNECVCGAANLKNVSLAPFPTGTGNDFCRMFGKEAPLFKNLEALLEGSIVPIDLIDCNGRYSANLCSVGVDARIGTNVHNYTSIPLVGGSLAYVISAVVEIFKGVNMPMHIKCGSYDVNAPHALCCVCNGRFYGGGFNPSLNAMPNDGLLDIYIAKGMSLPHLATAIGKYSTGRSDEVPELVTHLSGTELSIELEKPTVVNIDGEAIYSDKIIMKLIPGALNLIVPKGITFFD